MFKKGKVIYFVVLVLFCIYLISIIANRVYHTFLYGNNDYYFYYSNQYKDSLASINNNDDNDMEYKTVINHQNRYYNQNINNISDAINLINDDSLKEESKCTTDLTDIYNKIKEKTNIYGINLCELSYDKVDKIYNVLDYVYKNYPIISDYVTNITLVNDGGTSSYISAFKPSFTFATSNSDNKFPFVIKVQVFLNSSYYLNDKYMNLVLNNARSSNYFPKGVSDDSIIVHEFGHVITYVLAIKYYDSMNTILLPYDNFTKYSKTLREYKNSNFSKLIVDEAYNNYRKNIGNINEEEFRKGISGYANSYDDNGNVIYNEVIAEAIHDYYLNKDNSSLNSLEIIKVLNKYIEELS